MEEDDKSLIGLPATAPQPTLSNPTGDAKRDRARLSGAKCQSRQATPEELGGAAGIAKRRHQGPRSTPSPTRSATPVRNSQARPPHKYHTKLFCPPLPVLCELRCCGAHHPKSPLQNTGQTGRRPPNSLQVHLLLKIDAVGAAHLVEDFLNSCAGLLHVRGIVQVRRPLAATPVDALDEPGLGGVHFCDRRHVLLHDSCLFLGIFEVRGRALIGQHAEVWCGCADLAADLLESNLLQFFARDWLSAGPNQAEAGHGTCSLWRLCEGAPTGHEHDVAVCTLHRELGIDGAACVKPGPEVFHVTPFLLLDEDDAVYPLQQGE